MTNDRPVYILSFIVKTDFWIRNNLIAIFKRYYFFRKTENCDMVCEPVFWCKMCKNKSNNNGNSDNINFQTDPRNAF